MSAVLKEAGNRFAVLLTGGVLCLAVVAGSQAATGHAGVLNVRIGGDRTETRIVIDLDRAAGAKIAADGAVDRRLVLNLAGVSSADLQGGGAGLVKGWTLADTSAGVRLKVDFAADATVKRRFLLPPADGVGHYRYVIDLTAREPAVRLTSSPKTTLRATPVILKQPLSLKKVIVIDAGHGGRDPGARGAKAIEKDINLAAARALKARLERNGRYQVVMTRNSDVYVPLETRVQVARRADADLFISLHADSGSDSGMRGATVYTLSDKASSRAAKFVDKDDWFMKANLAGGGVSDILLDLTQRATKNRSAAFAEVLLGRVDDQTQLLRRSHRDAGFVVLLAPDVPAVLLEMGFITNSADEAILRDPTKRGRLMGAVSDAIDDYFDQQTRLAAR
ncbi:MAG: N-acetylmuramoyl-L-alanine amidase [Phenylobacterium sp.]|uniref:N-acetylmuramoyl-L-alanine amidase family protein n=1 Tax=Phenylobacterium sp. TaxID=1871053 RepID=UPI0027373DF4|nr:N-acetylmuramoyl-L-alanine amidase [Phenylobacterium sp.]MDP3174981.1 N-acetylmuramoyl-L-alanine amidase [Phenylobacterium sp.]